MKILRRLSLASIAEILRAPESGARIILERRLAELGKEISRIREQQHVIVRMLQDESLRDRMPVLDRKGWTSILRAAGLDEKGMRKWHKGVRKALTPFPPGVPRGPRHSAGRDTKNPFLGKGMNIRIAASGVSQLPGCKGNAADG
ncbi:MAG TPA: hypothetical protein PK587_09720 [Syntrophales bacterium]|nr:hypothetical protein [Syntrophales bacterium]